MPIRVDSGRGNWVEFRDDKWTFGDRMKVLNSSDDLALGEILKYVTGWNLTNVRGDPVPFDKGVGELLEVDDEVATWVIRAWFEAREKRRTVPKATS